MKGKRCNFGSGHLAHWKISGVVRHVQTSYNVCSEHIDALLLDWHLSDKESATGVTITRLERVAR